MKITVCIGSSCHLKGSRRVVESIQSFISENSLKDRIDLCGAFCMGNCKEGVCVTIGEDSYSVTPENVHSFCENEIKPRL